MPRSLFLAGAVNCALYTMAELAYAEAPGPSFNDLAPSLLLLLTACASMVLTLLGIILAVCRKEPFRRAVVLVVVCMLPMVLLVLHALSLLHWKA